MSRSRAAVACHVRSWIESKLLSGADCSDLPGLFESQAPIRTPPYIRTLYKDACHTIHLFGI